MDYYQMPMFNKLLVSDIQKAAKWYEKTLDLTVFLNLEMIKMRF